MKKAAGKPNWPKLDSAPAQQHLRPKGVRCLVPLPTDERGPLVRVASYLWLQSYASMAAPAALRSHRPRNPSPLLKKTRL
jgi:hypothetical protein